MLAGMSAAASFGPRARIVVMVVAVLRRGHHHQRPGGGGGLREVGSAYAGRIDPVVASTTAGTARVGVPVKELRRDRTRVRTYRSSLPLRHAAAFCRSLISPHRKVLLRVLCDSCGQALLARCYSGSGPGTRDRPGRSTSAGSPDPTPPASRQWCRPCTCCPTTRSAGS